MAAYRRLYYMVMGLLHELDEETLGRPDFQRKARHVYLRGHTLYRDKQMCMSIETPIQTSPYYAINRFIEKLLNMDYGTFNLEDDESDS